MKKVNPRKRIQNIRFKEYIDLMRLKRNFEKMQFPSFHCVTKIRKGNIQR